MSKYAPDFVAKVRTWYLTENKSDTEIAKLALRLDPPVVLTRNAVIGLRARANPRIERKPYDAWIASRENGAKAAKARWSAADGARDRETKPAPRPATPRPEPIRRPVPQPIQTPAAPPPYRTKGALAPLSGPTLLELEPGQCRNPVGPDATPTRPQMFCGERVQSRDVERRKGVFETVVDSYCARCAARNRVGTSSASSLIRSTRAFA